MSIELSAFEISELRQKKMVADEVKRQTHDLTDNKSAERKSLREARERRTVKIRHSLI
jgi:hypothetical protein